MWLISQVPVVSEAEVPSTFAPHIRPLACDCCSTGMMSTAMPSVATSWKAPKKLTMKPMMDSPRMLFTGSGISVMDRKLSTSPTCPNSTQGLRRPMGR